MKVFLLAMSMMFAGLSYGEENFEPALKISPFNLKWMNHDVAGTMYNSDDHAGAIFILEAYFLNCPYCNDNAPNIDALRDYYANNDMVQILDVGRDCKTSDYRKWIQRHSPNHPVLYDCDKNVLSQLGTRYYPSTYILDENLNVVKTYVGSWGQSTFDDITGVVDGMLLNP